MNKINNYGDVYIKTTGTHGADISSQRLDDLDIDCLSFVLNNYPKIQTAIDLGCGNGFHSFRLSLLNVNVQMYDILDLEDKISNIKDVLSLKNISYTQQLWIENP